jgi:hypothetical protein
MSNFVCLLFVSVCISLVAAQQQQQYCYPVDQSGYSTSDMCAGLTIPPNFPTASCASQNPVALNGSSGACGFFTFFFLTLFAYELCPTMGYNETMFCGYVPAQYTTSPFFMSISFLFHCGLAQCYDNSSCSRANSTTSNSTKSSPPYCYDCCVMCFGNDSACQNSSAYGTFYRYQNDSQVGCISCTQAPLAPTPTAPTLQSTGSTVCVSLVFLLGALLPIFVDYLNGKVIHLNFVVFKE